MAGLLSDIGNNLNNLFQQGGNFVNNNVIHPIQQDIQNWGQQNPQAAQQITQIPQQVSNFANNYMNTFNQTQNTQNQMANKYLLPMVQAPLSAGAAVSRSLPNSPLNQPGVQAGLQTPIGKTISSIAFGNNNTNPATQQIQQGFNQGVNVPVIGNVKGLAGGGLVAAGLGINLLPQVGGAEKAGMEEAVNIAKNANTVDDFAKGISEASPDAQKAVGKILADKNNPINTVEDFFNSVKGTPPLSPTAENVGRGVVTPQAGTEATPKIVAPQNPVITPRGFTSSVQESNEVSPQVQKAVQGTYTIKPNEALASAGKPVNTILDTLSQKTISDQDVADAIATAKSEDAKGNFANATQIYDKLAPQLTEAGRTVQAASLLENRTPQGLLYSSVATLKKAGVDLTPEINNDLEGLVNGVKNTLPGTPEKSMATQQLVQYVNNKIPRSLPNTIAGIWRAGLLTGPETVAKVIVSHSLTTPFELASQIPAELADRMMSLVTGKRSMTATLQGGAEGFAKGVGALGTKITKGLDVPNTGGFEQDFNSGTAQTAYEKFVQNVHGALPKPAFSARFNIALNDQALTEATNQGLKGAEKDAFVQNFVKNPPQPAIDEANKLGQIATNQQQTSLGKAASAIQKWNVGGIPVGKFLAPFTRIPTAIGVNGLWNYTPFGIGSEVVKAVQSGVFDQRTLAQAFGRSATGTTVMALGALLGENGLATLKAPADPKERALWDLQGKQPNSINIGGKWISLNAMGGLGLVLGIGAGLGQALKQKPGDVTGAIENGLAAGGGVLADQPYLQGIAGVGQALNDPSRYGQSLFNSTVGSVIPAASSQIARGFDTVQRTYPSSLVGKFQSEIPGARETLPPQLNLYGQTMPGSNPSATPIGGVIGTVNPFYPSTAKSDPLSTELQRLYDSQGSSGSPSIGEQSPNQTINGVKTKLNSGQLQTLIAQEGPQVKQQLTGLIQDPAYQSLSDEDKTNAINSVLNSVRQQVRGTINLSNPSIASANTNPTIGSVYTLINPDTGAVKKIDLSQPVPQPTLTGNADLDKKLTASYNSALTTRANDIVSLYKAGKMDAATAEAELQKLNTQKTAASGTGTKSKVKVSIKAPAMPKISSAKLTKMTKFKVSKTPTLKIAKAIASKMMKSQGAKFKITAPRVYLSSAGSSQRGVRRAAGISVPVRKRKNPILTV